jgi:hypothetical protein
MGRPLNKKYFGNRNIGSASTAADNGIGGGFVSSVTITTAGSYLGGASPTVTFSAPDKAAVGGVTATGTTVMEVLSAVATAGGTGYSVGDVLTVTYGGQTATFTVATLSTTAVATVTPLNRGTFTATTTGAKTTTVAPAGGTGATLTITYRVKDITITEQGSGYTNAADAAITFSGGTGAATAVLGTDSGIIGTTGNQENSITMIGFLTGGSAVQVDILRQVSTNRYKVTDGTRTGIVQLQSSLANAAGECSIVATDAAGDTYFVTKLTARRATLTRGTGTVFTTGRSVPWTLGTATSTVAKITNA